MLLAGSTRYFVFLRASERASSASSECRGGSLHSPRISTSHRIASHRTTSHHITSSTLSPPRAHHVAHRSFVTSMTYVRTLPFNQVSICSSLELINPSSDRGGSERVSFEKRLSHTIEQRQVAFGLVGISAESFAAQIHPLLLYPPSPFGLVAPFRFTLWNRAPRRE